MGITCSRVLLVLLALVTCRAELQLPFNLTKLRLTEYVGRYTSISTRSPVASEVRTNETARKALRELHGLFDVLSNTVETRIVSNSTISCNLRGAPWTRMSLDRVRAHQLGEMSSQCAAEFNGEEAIRMGEIGAEIIPQATQILREAKITLGHSVARASPSVLNNYTIVRDWRLVQDGQVCSLESAFAFRVNGSLYVQAIVTNRNVDAPMPEGQRHFVMEYISREFKALSAPQQRDDGVVEMSTTLLSTLAGQASLGSVPMGFNENPALKDSSERNRVAISQAQDAITPSNVAILALPMVMSLIPVSFVAELGTPATIWYIVFTDIFSALPFLIKGIELMSSGSVRRSQLSSYHVGNETLGQIEVWAAECRGKDEFRTIGVVFVLLAVSSIIIGTVIEIVAYGVMRRQREGGRRFDGPFGRVLFREIDYDLRRMEENWWEPNRSFDGRFEQVGAAGLAHRPESSVGRDGRRGSSRGFGWMRRQRRRV